MSHRWLDIVGCWTFITSVFVLLQTCSTNGDLLKRWKEIPLAVQSKPAIDCTSKVWPSLELFLPVHLMRSYSRNQEWHDVFLRSLLLFWPVLQSKTTLKIVMNQELEWTNMTRFYVLSPIALYREFLGDAFPVTSVAYSNLEANVYRTGHDRNQYLMFFADNYSTSEYVAFVDTDTVFHTYVDRDDLFDSFVSLNDEGQQQQGLRPIVHGRLRPYFHHHEQQQAKATFETIGVKEPMICMSYFPIIIKTAHLKEIRDFIVSHMNLTTFQEAFYIFSRRGVSMYSQFNIMCAYLWTYRRDEYSWYLHDSAPWWNGLTDPNPAPEQLADKSLFNEHLFYPKMYIAGHLYSRGKGDNSLASTTAKWLAGGLCWRYPTGQIEVIENLPPIEEWVANTLHVLNRTSSSIANKTLRIMGGSTEGSNCSTQFFGNGFFHINHRFEESVDWPMYNFTQFREVAFARRQYLKLCDHKYIMI